MFRGGFSRGPGTAGGLSGPRGRGRSGWPAHHGVRFPAQFRSRLGELLNPAVLSPGHRLGGDRGVDLDPPAFDLTPMAQAFPFRPG